MKILVFNSTILTILKKYELLSRDLSLDRMKILPSDKFYSNDEQKHFLKIYFLSNTVFPIEYICGKNV